MADDSEQIAVNVKSGNSNEPKISSSSMPIMTDKEADETDSEQHVAVNRSNKVIAPIDVGDKAESESESSEDDSVSEERVAKLDAEPKTDQESEQITVATEDEATVSDDIKENSDSEVAQVAPDNNPLGPTVADLSDHTVTTEDHKNRDYKITPNKLKKSPARKRGQSIAIFSTVILFLGIVSIVLVGLWMFMPGFGESLQDLFAL